MVDHSVGLESEDKLSVQCLLDRLICEFQVFDAFTIRYFGYVFYFFKKDLQDI